MKCSIPVLTILLLGCLITGTLWALTPEESRQYSEYQKKMVPLSEKLQKDLQDCGDDSACQMQLLFRFQSEMATIPLPDVPAYPSTDCGLLGSSYANCRNVSLEIRYGFDEKSFEWDNDGPYMNMERSLGFSYTVDGVLGYDDDFTGVHLFQRHPPLKENIRFDDGKYRSYRRVDGVVKTDTSLSLGNVDMDDPRSLISFFDLQAENAGDEARMAFNPFHLVTGPRDGDVQIAGLDLPPDGADAVMLDPSELKSLIPEGGQWSFTRSFDHAYDDMGSKYHLTFSVKAVSVDETPATASGNPAPAKKKGPVLDVSPNEDFQAKRKSKKDLYTPREKTYTLTNAGDAHLSYSVASDETWLHPRSDSGSLKPKESRALTIRLDKNADKLDEKKHLGQVRIINLSGGKGSTSRKAVLSTGEKWRFSHYGYTHHTIDGGTLAGGMIVFWQTDVDFYIMDGKFKNGQGRSYLVKTRSFSYPPGIFSCDVVKKNWIGKKLNNHPTPYVDEANFPMSGSAAKGFVTLNFPNTSNEYYLYIQCVLDTDALKGYGYIPWKTDPTTAHPFAGRMRPTGAHSYELKSFLIESGEKGVSKDYEASEMKQLE